MYFKQLLIASALFFQVTAQGGVTNSAPESRVSIPVSWNTGFTLPELLASTIEFTSIEDLEQLIAAPWYADITMTQTKAGESVFNTCHNYFEQAIETTRTAKENEMGPYLEFKVMCEAGNLLLSAKNATSSYLPELVLSNNLPNLLPKSVALQTSLEESKRNANNAALTHWADITPLTNYESQSATKSTYYHDGGYQELEIIGRGDTNNDHIEDVIVVVHDYLDGGNYMNIRLLVLSVDRQNNWQLLKAL
ncbi:hypothetical protein [Colwellia psychrerythraea]|uniref:Lipoprotein n=1 Tax=Colwellia psychrerythraea TaxID=28229 RepID=A0A099K9T2_COLPS|nr:hypothetical protein [Colwellia psychrerythraea]KGJ86832.1 hypothetical protein GAB14E_4659 [Colwellia psychrerythraea]